MYQKKPDRLLLSIMLLIPALYNPVPHIAQKITDNEGGIKQMNPPFTKIQLIL